MLYVLEFQWVEPHCKCLSNSKICILKPMKFMKPKPNNTI